MSRCPLSISPSIPCITRLRRQSGQAAGGQERAPWFAARGGTLLGARYEPLTVDAEAAVSRLKDLHKRMPCRIRRLLRRLENDVGNALDHGGLLLQREQVGGKMKLHQRCAEVGRRSGLRQSR